MLLQYIVFIIFCSNYANSLKYNVKAIRYSSTPILSKTLGSKLDYIKSAALFIDTNNRIGVIVEAANFFNSTMTTKSQFYYSSISFKNGIPIASQPSDKPIFSIPDTATFPRIIRFNDLYYVLFQTSKNLSIAITSDPKNPNAWINDGIISASNHLPSYGAPLLASKENGLKFNYLYTSNSFMSPYIYVAKIEAGTLIWNSSFLTLANSGYGQAIHPGNPPLQLKTGDFFQVNNYAQLLHGKLSWSLGYTILNKTNPDVLVQRSKSPILFPTLDWELSLNLTGLLPDKINCPEENDWTQCFLGLYSGALSHIGAFKIIVSW